MNKMKAKVKLWDRTRVLAEPSLSPQHCPDWIMNKMKAKVKLCQPTRKAKTEELGGSCYTD